MLNRIALLILLIGGLAYGQDQDQLVLDAGVGVGNSGKHSISETKLVTLGSQAEVWGPLKQRLTVGGFLDNAGNGRKGSALLSGQLGFEVNNNGWIGGVFTGPTFLGQTDSMLGGHLQFMDEAHFGMQDQDWNYIGVIYRHISSGGLATPNIGRDAICIELRF